MRRMILRQLTLRFLVLKRYSKVTPRKLGSTV